MSRAFFLMMLCFCQFLSAQRIPSRKYSIQDGLINSTIYRLHEQDSNLLWFTSAYGVSSFDGMLFRNYTINGKAMSTIGITSTGKTVWVSTINEGIWYFENESWKKWQLPSGNFSTRVYQMKADHQNRIWLLDEAGRVGYISANRELSVLSGLPAARFIHADGKHSVYFVTEKGLYLHINQKPKQLFSTDAWSMDTDKSGNIFLGSKGKVYKFYSSGERDSILLPDNTEVKLIRVDKRGNIWCSSAKPAFYRLSGNKLWDLTSQLGLNNTYINDIHIDNEDNIFLATYGAGVHKISSTSICRYDIESGLSTNIINVIGEDPEGNMLAGGFGGLAVFDKDKNTFNDWLLLGINEQVNALKLANDELWIGTNYNVYRYREFFKKFPVSCLSLLLNNDSVFISSYSRLAVLHRNTTSMPAEYIGHPKLKGRINAMCRSSDGTIWYAGAASLLSNNNGVFREFLKGLQINDILPLGNKLWVSSNQGIYCKTAKTWQHYTLKDGLNNLYTTALAIDRKGRLWAGSYKGLHWFDGKRFHLLRHGLDLPSEMILSLYTDKEGSVWFGTNNGLYRLDVEALLLKPSVPRLFISELEANGLAIVYSSGLSLSHQLNNISLSFRSPGYTYPGEIIYEYRLSKDNSEGNWITAPGKTLELSSLAHGLYSLELRARYKGEELSSVIHTRTFRIMEPFWLSWWFISILFISIITGVYLIVRSILTKALRKRQLKARQHLKFLKLKQQALESMIAPHFIFNSLNSVQSFINTSDKRSANKYISDFASLIRQTLDASAGFEVNLEEEIERIRLYLSLEKMRLGEKLNYSIRVDKALSLSQIRIPSLLIQPFIENAIWHGIMPAGGNVDLIISAHHEGKIRIVIADDGVGMENSIKMKNANSHKSLGMAIIRKRLEFIGQITERPFDSSLRFNEAVYPNRGTTVEMELPVF